MIWIGPISEHVDCRQLGSEIVKGVPLQKSPLYTFGGSAGSTYYANCYTYSLTGNAWNTCVSDLMSRWVERVDVHCMQTAYPVTQIRASCVTLNNTSILVCGGGMGSPIGVACYLYARRPAE